MLKRTLLFLVFFLGLVPVVEHSRLSFFGLQQAHAEYGSEDDDNSDDNDCWKNPPPGGCDLEGVEVHPDPPADPWPPEDPPGHEPEPNTDPCETAPDCDCPDYAAANPWECDPFYYDDPPTEDPTQESNPDCPPSSKEADLATNKIYDDNISAGIAGFDPFTPGSGQNEQQFLTNYNPSTGQLQNESIQTLGPTGGSSNITNWTAAKTHTHPAGTDPVPSALDIYSLGDGNGFSNRYKDSFTKAADGSEYALHVSDPVALAGFMATNGNFVDPATNRFLAGSAIENSYKNIESNLKAAGYSNNEAAERALAAVLKDSGITMLKKDGNGDFKPISLKQAKNPDGTPKTKNGKPVYEKVDC